jgi:hypothetical protein
MAWQALCLAALSSQPPKPEGSRRKARGVDGESACRAIMGSAIASLHSVGGLLLLSKFYDGGKVWISTLRSSWARRRSEASLPSRSSDRAPQPYMRWIPAIRPRCSHAHRRRGSSEAGPFSLSASKPWMDSGLPPPRIISAFVTVIRTYAESGESLFLPNHSCRRTQYHASRHRADRHVAPQYDQQLAGQRDNHNFAQT